MDSILDSRGGAKERSNPAGPASPSGSERARKRLRGKLELEKGVWHLGGPRQEQESPPAH